jgi:hypothetical protein
LQPGTPSASPSWVTSQNAGRFLCAVHCHFVTRAEVLKAHTFHSPVGLGGLEIPAIRGVGGSLRYFLEAAGKNWDTDFEVLRSDAASDRLIAVDHISQSMPYDEMLSWLLFYTGILDLQRLPQMEDSGQLLRITTISKPNSISMRRRWQRFATSSPRPALHNGCRLILGLRFRSLAVAWTFASAQRTNWKNEAEFRFERFGRFLAELNQ